MIAKIYLIVVSLIYLGLAAWCSFKPTFTSAKVGFDLKGGSGRSEFLTVYGGLEFGIGIVLIASLFSEDTLRFGVLACLLIHSSLVVFRTISFFCFADIEPFTYRLAIGEWVIALTGIAIYIFSSPAAVNAG